MLRLMIARASLVMFALGWLSLVADDTVADDTVADDTVADESATKVDVNLDVKHVVRGVSDFGRHRHITVHSNLTESDWVGEADAMNYLMNELDAYFGRDNGQASWIFQRTPQDPKRPSHPDLAESRNFGKWFKNFYDSIPAERRAYERRNGEMIMGTNPNSLYPTQNYRQNSLAGADDEMGKYILRDSEPAAEWVAEYLAHYFREEGEATGMPLPKYWEIVNEPDMNLNARGHFMMSSWEALFEYHNLMADQIRLKLGDRAPLIGGMTWGLHDLGNGDLYTRFKERNYVENYYGKTPADLAAIELAYKKTASKVWERDHGADFFQWDVIWKGFIDECGSNMDFYSIHLYDWSPTGDDPRWHGGKYRSGGHVEAVLEMVDWYQQHKFGEPKPWVLSEYGSIPTQVEQTTDYRYADWMHVKTWNQMFLQFLTRPDMIVKSMPFAPVKAKWGATAWADGKQKRYEASLMQTDHADVHSPDAEWFFTDKIQWYELWSDVKGTRVDTWSSDPDIQVDAYVDGRHAYVILNNLEWESTVVDLSVFGADNDSINSVRMKHSYLGEGLSSTNIGRGVLADATLPEMPDSVVLQPGSTIILDIEYAGPLAITHVSNEHKYYGESLSSAGKEDGAVHRTELTQNAVTGQVNGVKVPEQGEAVLRVTGRFAISQAIVPRLAEFLVNGHQLELDTDSRMVRGREIEVFDFMGLDFEHTSHRELRVLEIPIPLEYLKENNEISVRVGQLAIYTNMNIVTWDMSKQIKRTSESDVHPRVPVADLAVSNRISVSEKHSVALPSAIKPENASDQTIHWTSSDLSVAIVDENGLVTGLGPGEATLTAATRDGDHQGTTSVTVTRVVPTSVAIIPLESELRVGKTTRLSVGVLPRKVSNDRVDWKSSDATIAQVNDAGVITGLRAGVVTITATTREQGLTANSSLRVVPVALESIAISPAKSLVPLESDMQLNTTFTPVDASDRTVQWISSDSSVATVDRKGLVKTRAVGTATIRAVSTDGAFQSQAVITVVRVEGEPTYVQAESFTRTGGRFQGFKIDSKVGHTNWNQTGDWADYEVEFSKPGVYQITLDAGTPIEDAGVEVLINGVSAGQANVPVTGDWAVMKTTVVTNALVVSKPGKQTIRIQSVGAAGAWQWNADRFGYLRLGSP